MNHRKVTMEKISFRQLKETFENYNLSHNVTPYNGSYIAAILVFKPETWPGTEYSLKERSYRIKSSCKYFIPACHNHYLKGDCLDGKDKDVDIKINEWQLDYCYITDWHYKR